MTTYEPSTRVLALSARLDTLERQLTEGDTNGAGIARLESSYCRITHTYAETVKEEIMWPRLRFWEEYTRKRYAL